MPTPKPLPLPNFETAPFWNGCREHVLKFQRCTCCGFVRWPPSILCPGCHSMEAEWIRSKGEGRVFSFVVYHKDYHPSFEEDLPYATAVVELDEGPRLLTRLVGADFSKLVCEMRVRVVWQEITGEISLPVFTPCH